MADQLVSDLSVAIFGAVPDWNLPAASFPNHFCAIEATSNADPIEAPVTALQDGRPWTWWRSTGGQRWQSTITGAFLSGVRKVGCIAVTGASLTPNAKIRWRLTHNGNTDDIPGRTRLAPTGLVSSAGVTGGLAEVSDDPASPGGTHIVVTSSTNHVHLSWPTPASFEAAVAGAHSFRVAIQNTGSGDVSLTAAGLYESGILRKDLIEDRDGATREMVFPAGYDDLVEFPFSASDLVATSGINLEFRLSFGSPATAGELRIRAIDLHYSDVLPSVDYYDTGLDWAWTDGILGVAGGSGLTDIHPTETWTESRAFAHAVRVDGVFENLDEVFQWQVEIHDPWAAFVQIATLPVGPAVGMRILPDVSWSSDNRAVFVESAAGHVIGAFLRGRLVQTAPAILSRADVDYLHRLLAGGRSVGYPFVYVPQPAGETVFLGIPRAVMVKAGSQPDVTLYARTTPGEGLWRLGGLSLVEVW